ncbi:unnamed protein product, partial [Nesidiocoris tenuis]
VPPTAENLAKVNIAFHRLSFDVVVLEKKKEAEKWTREKEGCAQGPSWHRSRGDFYTQGALFI